MMTWIYTGSEQPDVNVPVMVFRRIWWICARFDNDIYFGFQNDLLQFALMGLQEKKNRNIKSFLVWFNISVLNNRDILSAELHKVVSVKTFAGNMCVCSVKSHCMLLLNDTVSAENPFDSVSWHLLVWINMYNLSLCYFDLCQGWYLSIFLCTLT